ncbi:MAG: hypothetical protein MJ041_06200, partial [Acidaminococcaceae bacterium]|nr:hypothetical protein [Acidaminococcaceae bacterium]
ATPIINIEGKWSGDGVNFAARSYKLQNEAGQWVKWNESTKSYDVVATEAEASEETIAAGTAIFPADIYVLGSLQNLTGDVKIKSSNNNIVVTGSDGAGIRGSKILLQAEHGSVTQLKPGETVNIGNSPELYYGEIFNNFTNSAREFDSNPSDTSGECTWATAYAMGFMSADLAQWYSTLSNEAKADLENGQVTIDGTKYPLAKMLKINSEIVDTLQKDFKPLYDYLKGTSDGEFLRFSMHHEYQWRASASATPTSRTVDMQAIVRKDGDIAKPGDGSIAGANVYILADNINVNGIVQSGYGKYQLALTAADEARIQEIKAAHTANNPGNITSGNLTDAEVLNNPTYCTREGGE